MNNWDRYVATCNFLDIPPLPNTGEWKAQYAELYHRCIALRDAGVNVPNHVFGFKDTPRAS